MRLALKSLDNNTMKDCRGHLPKMKLRMRCGSDKTPNPDDLIFIFIKEFWEVIKVDMLCFMAEFFVHGTFPKGCNASFIALIPKVNDLQKPK